MWVTLIKNDNNFCTLTSVTNKNWQICFINTIVVVKSLKVISLGHEKDGAEMLLLPNIYLRIFDLFIRNSVMTLTNQIRLFWIVKSNFPLTST